MSKLVESLQKTSAEYQATEKKMVQLTVDMESYRKKLKKLAVPNRMITLLKLIDTTDNIVSLKRFLHEHFELEMTALGTAVQKYLGEDTKVINEAVSLYRKNK